MPTRKSPGATATPDVLDDALLRAIAERGGVRSWGANTVLLTEQDASDALYVILSGRVKAYGAADDGREVVYSTQGAGEYFGEMSLDGGPRSASIMTLEPTTCAVVPGPEVRDFLASQPDFALHLVKKLIKMVRANTEQVKSLALDDVYGRIARLLRKLAREDAAHPGVAVVPDRMTQQDIAERIGSSREMVSRVFKPLVEGGWVEMREGRIALLKKLPAKW
jgi:CRP/FNR family transcriptional regulator, cyclic AMP receptor protein